ncbi:MAG TPA: hypothetical protein H9759_12355 [Candidatus Dietzia intestinipullorum]|nr:hypothetical protein [Candidatus Dietzia intestinipullorum]
MPTPPATSAGCARPPGRSAGSPTRWPISRVPAPPRPASPQTPARSVTGSRRSPPASVCWRAARTSRRRSTAAPSGGARSASPTTGCVWAPTSTPVSHSTRPAISWRPAAANRTRRHPVTTAEPHPEHDPDRHPDTAGEAVREEVLALVRAMAPEADGPLGDADRLVDDLGYQSLRLVELTMALEETFDLPPFDRADLTGVATVGDVLALIDRHRGADS